MVCELFSRGYKIIRFYVLLNHLNSNNKLFTLVKAPQTTDLLLWLHPQDFIHWIIILELFCYIICYAVDFLLCLFYCHVLYKKSRVSKFWGFFMYLLFLGIVQNNTMKLDNARTQIGKLCFGNILSDMKCFSSLLTEGVPLKRDHWLSEFSASAKIKFQIGIVSFSLRLSCQILVHRLGWKESRLGKKDKPSLRKM